MTGLAQGLGALAAAVVTGAARERARGLAVIAAGSALAAALLLGAVALLVVAGHLALLDPRFTPLHATLPMAAALALAAILALGVAWLIATPRCRRRAVAVPALPQLAGLASLPLLGRIRPGPSA